eukprot:8932690-Ditylum_brightwellii.AAC.1
MEESKGPTEKERKIYQKAVEEEKQVNNYLYKKLSNKEKEALNNAKSEKCKEQNKRGFGLQYYVNQQLGALTFKTILAPMMPQSQGSISQNQVNSVTGSSGEAVNKQAVTT